MFLRKKFINLHLYVKSALLFQTDKHNRTMKNVGWILLFLIMRKFDSKGMAIM